MKVLHCHCLNYNIGDHALGIGLRNLLRRHLHIDLIGSTNIQGREFNEYYLHEVVNKRYDLLVIGGGGIIHGAHWPNGWFWLIEKERIQTIRIPFIVYAAGYNYWAEEGGIPPHGADHLRETIQHAKYFSVRNDGSAKRLLAQTGIQAAVAPDPGFHVGLDSRYERPEKGPYVMIQLANDKPDRRFGENTGRQRIIAAMREITRELSRTYKVIFSPHVLDDVSLSLEVSRGIENTMVWEFGSFAFDHVEQAIAYYQYAEWVIAMRGHGQILPLAFNTPVISLENHPKHRGLMEELGLLEYNVAVREEGFLSSLRRIVEKVQQNRSDLVSRYAAINQELLRSSDDAFTRIKDSIR